MRLFYDTPSYSSANFPPPRPFQSEAHEKLRVGFADGHRCQMLMSGTGSGKTYIAMRLAHESLKKGKRVIFVCDRRNLIKQTSAVADSYGLSAHSVLMSNHWRYSLDMPFQIASSQTLARRSWPDADLIIIDEAHTQYKAWTDHIQKTDAAVIGLSATPFSSGLGKLFSNLVCASSIHELTTSGVLVPLRVLSCTPTNMEGAATAGGEWTDRAAQERGMEIIGDVVTEWIKFGEDRKTIVFGATIAHCEELCRQFNECGVMASVFCADTSEEDRERILEEFKKPDSIIRVLISVEALSKGMDQKDVGCVVDCRPLRKSLSTFIQMVGRGLRSSPETDKRDCILLDHSGNILRFKEDFEDIYFNGLSALDNGEKLDKAIRKDKDPKEATGCPRCQRIPFNKRCMACGFELVVQALVGHTSGQMQEVVIGKKKMANNDLHLYQQHVTYVRSHGNPQTQKQRAAHMFKRVMGEWPSRAWDFDSMPNVTITQPVLNKIRADIIAYSKVVKR